MTTTSFFVPDLVAPAEILAPESVAPAELPVEAALQILRDSVFDCATDAFSMAEMLSRRVGLLQARVQLLASAAAAAGGSHHDRDRIDKLTRGILKLAPSDPDVRLELATALFVVQDDPRPASVLLDGLRNALPSRAEPGTASPAVRYLLRTGHTRQARAVLDALLPRRRLISPWGSAAEPNRFGTTEPSTFTRQLLTAALAASDELLPRSADDLPLRRMRAYAFMDLGQNEAVLRETAEILRWDRSDAEARWAEIVALARLGRADEALTRLGRMPAATPEVASLRIRLLLASGSAEKAVSVADDAAQRYPDDVDVRVALAEALVAAGSPATARNQIEDLLRTHPNDAVLLAVKGRMQYADGDATGAVETLQRAVEEDPNDPDTHVALAQALASKGDQPAAFAHLDIALERHPQRADIQVERARMLRSAGHSVEALETLDAVAEGAAGAEAARELRADLLLDLNREREAISWYARSLNEALESGGDAQHFADALEATAYRLSDQERYEDALDALEPLLRAGLLSVDGMSLRAELLRLTGNLHESIAQADEVLATGTEDVWIRGTKAATLFELSRSREALDLLDPALKESPNYLFGQYLLVAALDELGRMTEALRVADEQLVDVKEDGDWEFFAVSARARLLVDVGRHDEAVRILKDALASGRNEASWFGILAGAYSRLGKPKRALDTMRRAIAVAHGDLPDWAWVELADALSRVHRGSDEESDAIYSRLASKSDEKSGPKEIGLRAWCQLRLGEVTAAITRYREAIDAAKDPLINERLQLGLALLLADRQQEAQSIIERTVDVLSTIADRAAITGYLSEARYAVSLLSNDKLYANRRSTMTHMRRRLEAAERTLTAGPAVLQLQHS